MRWHSARSFPALSSAAFTCTSYYTFSRAFQISSTHSRIYLDASPYFPLKKTSGAMEGFGIDRTIYRPVNRLKDLVPITSLYTVRQNSIGIIPYSHLEPALKIKMNSDTFNLSTQVISNIFFTLSYATHLHFIGKRRENSHVNQTNLNCIYSLYHTLRQLAVSIVSDQNMVLIRERCSINF